MRKGGWESRVECARLCRGDAPPLDERRCREQAVGRRRVDHGAALTCMQAANTAHSAEENGAVKATRQQRGGARGGTHRR